MVRVITVLVMLVLSYFFSKLDAQNNNTSPCSSTEYNQFNFWIGNWNVYDSENKLIGQNNIKEMPNACTIQENWTSQNGKSLGTSYSYYNLADKKWHQLWIDNKGYVLETEGNFTENKMVLESKVIKNPNGDYINRITWTNNSDGTVTQIWEFVGTDGKLIRQAFKGIYKKKNS